jgi:CubicO group peptidase (beta-lactamase class C family)
MRVGNRLMAVVCLFLPAGLAVVVCGPLDAEAPRPTRADPRINELLEPIRHKHKLPALAGAIVTSRGLVAVGAVGVRKRGSKVAVTVDDQFHLGSDSKAMTATMIARLVEDGRLRYDTTLAKAFPELAGSMAPDVGKITLLQLLTHRSGLAANLKGGWVKVADKGTPRQQRLAAVRLAVKEKPENRPGEKFGYSNLGYVVASAMAEKAADASWERLMAREVFRPLHMSTAGFGAAGSPDKIDQP